MINSILFDHVLSVGKEQFAEILCHFVRVYFYVYQYLSL